MMGRMTQVVPFRMSRPAALQIIRSAAAESRLVWLHHAKKRMRQRRITPAQVISCLLKGVMTEGPAMDIKGYWRCTMERLTAGEEIQVVVSFSARDRVLVISVM